MKVLLGMKAVVVGVLWVLMVLGAEAHKGKDAFSLLCEVLRSAERVLNDTGRKDGPLKEALYGRKDRASFSVEDPVTMKGDCRTMRLRNLLCTYKSGTSGCFAESVAGSLTCTLEKWNGHFQNAGNQARDKCLHRSDNKQETRHGDVGALEEALKEVRNTLKEGSMRGRTLFYLGEGMGLNGCSGGNRNDVCAGYYGAGKTRDTVPIPWLRKIQQALEELKKTPKTAPAPATPTHTAPNPREPEALKDTEVSESEAQNITTEEEHTEDIFPPGNPSSPENQPSPKGRSKRSTTEGHTITSTAPEDTSTTEEPEILDPTAAPFPPADGTDILTPLGLFMAASSFF